MTMSVEPFTRDTKFLPSAERATREELAAAHRLSARHGMIDLTHTHFSARVPGSPDHFLNLALGPLVPRGDRFRAREGGRQR